MPYESKGCRFESCWARHKIRLLGLVEDEDLEEAALFGEMYVEADARGPFHRKIAPRCRSNMTETVQCSELMARSIDVR